MSIGGFRLPWWQIAYQVQLFFIQDPMTFVVSLPRSVEAQTGHIDGSQRESFRLPCLGQAMVGGDGTVTLREGLVLRAVEVVPGWF